MHGDVVASELDRYSESLLFEQRGKVLFAPKKKKDEKRADNFYFYIWWDVEKKERTIDYGDNARKITMSGWRHDSGCCS